MTKVRSKRFVWIVALIVMLTAVPVGGVVFAGCDTDAGGDTSCSGDDGEDVEDNDDGNSIEVEADAEVSDTKNDPDRDAISGNGGNDTINNEGTVNGNIDGGPGADSITNEGTVNGSIEGGENEEGRDEIVNEGEADAIFGDNGKPDQQQKKPIDCYSNCNDNNDDDTPEFGDDYIENNGETGSISGDGLAIVEVEVDYPKPDQCKSNDIDCLSANADVNDIEEPEEEVVEFGDDEIVNEGSVDGTIQGDGNVMISIGSNGLPCFNCEPCRNCLSNRDNPNGLTQVFSTIWPFDGPQQDVTVEFGDDEITNNGDVESIVGDGNVSQHGGFYPSNGFRQGPNGDVEVEYGDDTIVVESGSVQYISGDGNSQRLIAQVRVPARQQAFVDECDLCEPVERPGGDDEITIGIDAEGGTFIDGGGEQDEGDTLIFEVSNNGDREQVDAQRGSENGSVLFSDGRKFSWIDIENLLAILIGGTRSDDGDDEDDVVLLVPVALFDDLKDMVVFLGGDGLAMFRYTEDLVGISVGFVSYDAIAAGVAGGDPVYDETTDDGYRVVVSIPEEGKLLFEMFEPDGTQAVEFFAPYTR